MAKAQGKHLVKIDRWFASSKTCSCCDHKVDSLPLAIRFWTCAFYHTEHDRYINAAINTGQLATIKIRAEGLSVSANGGLRKPSQFTYWQLPKKLEASPSGGGVVTAVVR
ncbi:zinc ribbon domain-containing protein [Shewanella mangrovi]|uniref:zinc ribbon domain-containing protein n=1 Tax=Shewanella mangrovi TaxID=1515746 RepID=UPI0009DE7EC0|nr:zinc ribbon domain-containing protein [Shewanella mangrovi]